MIPNTSMQMKKIEIRIGKQDVYREVAMTTSYTGAKKQGDEMAYNRIFTTDADREALERFWNEGCDAVTDSLKEFAMSEANTAEAYILQLDMSAAWDEVLKVGMEKSISSFLVNYIVAKWSQWTAKDEMKEYATTAEAMLADVVSKAYYRKKPKRIIPNI